MEIIYIGVGIFLVWLVRTLHKSRCRDQEEADKKIAFAKWAKEQHDPHIVSMVQNFMREGRVKTLEEAALYAERALNTPSPEPRSSSHATTRKEHLHDIPSHLSSTANPCEAIMPFLIRPDHRFSVQCLAPYGLGNVSVWGFLFLALVLGGCTEWTIPPCKGTPFNTPCVGPCTVDAEPAVPNYTQVTMPLAVVIQDKYGKLHCQEIKP